VKEQAFLTSESRQRMNEKANKFLERECIEQTGKDEWICKPIPKYNIHTYTIQKLLDDTYRCNCQGFHKNNYCSHIEAVRIFISRNTPVTAESQRTFAYA